jgi:HSP20 family protein
MQEKPLKKWDPFRELVILRDDMDRLFNTFLGRRIAEESEGLWAPIIDIEEDRDNYTVRAELPGMKKEDIKISVRGNMLTLSGERVQEADSKTRTFHRVERLYGRFSRTISLPSDVETDKVRASYKDGVLVIALPKPEMSKPEEIEIEVK